MDSFQQVGYSLLLNDTNKGENKVPPVQWSLSSIDSVLARLSPSPSNSLLTSDPFFGSSMGLSDQRLLGLRSSLGSLSDDELLGLVRQNSLGSNFGLRVGTNTPIHSLMVESVGSNFSLFGQSTANDAAMRTQPVSSLGNLLSKTAPGGTHISFPATGLSAPRANGLVTITEEPGHVPISEPTTTPTVEVSQAKRGQKRAKKKRKKATKPLPTDVFDVNGKQVDDLCPTDIIDGKGSGSSDYPGNKTKGQIVNFYARKYADIDEQQRKEKLAFSSMVVDVLQNNFKARFLRKVTKKNRWVWVIDTPEQARDRIAKALRERRRTLKKQEARKTKATKRTNV